MKKPSENNQYCAECGGALGHPSKVKVDIVGNQFHEWCWDDVQRLRALRGGR